MAGERIVFTNDLDGIHFKAPPPMRTALQLVRRNFSLPPDIAPLPAYERRDRLRTSFSIVFHRIRPFNSGSIRLLRMFRDAAAIYGRDISVVILSGREVELHGLTERRLKKSQLGQYIDEYYLNRTTSASNWKAAKVREFLEAGNSVVHIDDDLRPALRIASLNQRQDGIDQVSVYLMRNISNHPRLLERAGVVLPPNVIHVSDFVEAGTDFARRLRMGLI